MAVLLVFLEFRSPMVVKILQNSSVTSLLLFMTSVETILLLPFFFFGGGLFWISSSVLKKNSRSVKGFVVLARREWPTFLVVGGRFPLLWQPC